MKKLLLLLILATCWLVSNAEKQPILSYGDYSPLEIERFSKGSSAKARQFAEILLLKTGETNLSVLFQNVFVKDTFLLEGSYRNSRWNTETGQIEFFLGKKFTGKVAIYKNNKFEQILYKCACANILDTPKKFLGIIEEDLPYVPKTVLKSVPEPVVIVEKPEIKSSSVVLDYKPVQKIELNLNLNPTVVVKKRGEIKIWKIVIPVGVMIIAAIDFFSGKKIQALSERRMPAGLPVEPQTTPGIPADPRTMPPGIR